MILLRIHHIHQGGYCSRGARAWCLRHNVNYTEFILRGIAVERIEAFGDAFAMDVCRIARNEHAAKQKEQSDGQE